MPENKSFNPQPTTRDDGGTDYTIPGCNQVCYQTDNEGCYVGQCPCLVVSVHGLRCSDNNC